MTRKNLIIFLICLFSVSIICAKKSDIQKENNNVKGSLKEDTKKQKSEGLIISSQYIDTQMESDSMGEEVGTDYTYVLLSTPILLMIGYVYFVQCGKIFTENIIIGKYL